MSIQKKHEELIESSYKELEILRSEVTQLEDIRKNIEILISGNNDLPPLFLELYQKLEALSVTYTKGIDDITRQYLSDANTYFVERLIELQTEIGNLKSQIERISSIDFTGLFDELQKVFINQTRADLEVELQKFDEKSKDLQAKINEIQKQIERLEKIDLEKHFAELQKTLAEIFGAINAINLTLTNIIQTLTGIVQSLGTIQTTLDINHNEAKQLLNSFSDSTEKHLTDQDKQAAKNAELLESKIKSLSEQNELLKKEVKTNRIIQIVGLTIILSILIYVAINIKTNAY
jgi:hypothetical protein